MLDSSTLYLLLSMVAFVFVAVVVVHQHNCSDAVRRKRNEVNSHSNKLERKIDILEQDIVQLQLQIDELDDQIDTFKA